MPRRPLPRVRWPLPGEAPAWLVGDEGRWALLLSEGAEPVPVRVDVLLDLGCSLCLRLRWTPPGAGWFAKFWPRQRHVYLRQPQMPADWPLLRAQLKPSRRRHWLGAP